MKLPSIKARVLVFAVAALGVSATVMAGYRQSVRTVVVDASARYARGHLSGARASSDSTQLLVCTLTTHDSSPDQVGGTSVYGNCLARDARGVTGFCLTWDPVMIATMAALQNDSTVYFSWAPNGSCTSVEVAQGSYLEPKY
jgi:hypothetical protein